ncbi:hypothetical protein EMIHUDRAFT_243800 [Emiliania huxleyi CCMP1516]|uniref:Uncharacterized protein n=2 Tax=Emiliania huxleyi TaxID=2903 RepID=A0A0D3J4U7_EMIH1|nr:hypothetical protein EMIHUDRAFT_103307 [Emiliania huxleyi CCMP1516]XP_005770961.1 hypothetical protein EMIHUDRAFT_243800 [Emiliania huxleyi CCMP1516]EOD15333.1 hypothetical protein EMIHUDRAFT_103307 [Emiliania huxleyi CCMP1516]EOD18532.1 hypothetical protein EMIHUDRAFT_243800 [Emiliania huxleyi CCMP1516]|eukprot:XP_005767762.1 hypothetical protein EMIHUDRAFT_103307 [Emiliania huxleyi CCMP1516]
MLPATDSWISRADASTRAGVLLGKAGGSCARGCTSGEKLHWWGKGVTDEDCLSLAKALSAQSGRELKNLLLGTNSVGDACVRALASSARAGHLKELRALGLSGNRITDDGCEAWAGAWRDGGASLIDLYLSRQRGDGLTDRCATSLAAAIGAAGGSLRRLSMGDSGLSMSGLAALLQAAASGSSALRELSLNNNSICGRPSPPVVEALRRIADSAASCSANRSCAGRQRSLRLSIRKQHGCKALEEQAAAAAWRALQTELPSLEIAF